VQVGHKRNSILCRTQRSYEQDDSHQYEYTHTARSVEDETRNAELNDNRNPEWWGNFSRLVKIQKIKFLGISRYKVELRFWLNLNSEISRGTNSNWDFCLIWIWSWLKSPHHSGLRLPFNSAFRVSSSTERAVRIWRFMNVTICDAYNEYSCRKYEWVMSHIRMSHVAHMTVCMATLISMVLLRSYEWVMSNSWKSHFKCMIESCPTHESCRMYEYVMSHVEVCVTSWLSYMTHGRMYGNFAFDGLVEVIEMSHLANMNQSCRACEWGTVYMAAMISDGLVKVIGMSHVAHMNEPCRKYELIMSHMSHICAWGMSRTWQYMRDMTNSYLRHESFICATWLIPMTLRMRDVTHMTVYGSFDFRWSCEGHKMRHVAHTNESCRTYEWVMSHTLQRAWRLWFRWSCINLGSVWLLNHL